MSGFLAVAEARRRYRHGSNARYHLGKCRCAPCRAAARAYADELRARKEPVWAVAFAPRSGRWIVKNLKTGEIADRVASKAAATKKANARNAEVDPNALVPIGPLLAHVKQLQAQGVGIKPMARAAKLAQSVLNRMIVGDIKRTRRSTLQRVLAVTAEAASAGARMRVDESLVLLDRLVSAGYRKGWIAQQLGVRHPNLSIGKTPWITIKLARKLHDLYTHLAATNPSLPATEPFRLSEMQSSGERCGGRHAKRRAAAPSPTIFHSHGTLARYEAGCRCRPCTKQHRLVVDAKTRTIRQRYLLRKRGPRAWAVLDAHTNRIACVRKTRTAAIAVRDDLNRQDPLLAPRVRIDAAPVRAHILELLEAGVAQTDIARAANVSGAHVIHIARGRGKQTSHTVAQRLLAVNTDARSATMRIDAAPSAALLERLYAVGFESSWLAKLANLTPRQLTLSSRTIRLDRARVILSLYSSLRERVGSLRDLEALQGTPS